MAFVAESEQRKVKNFEKVKVIKINVPQRTTALPWEFNKLVFFRCFLL